MAAVLTATGGDVLEFNRLRPAGAGYLADAGGARAVAGALLDSEVSPDLAERQRATLAAGAAPAGAGGLAVGAAAGFRGVMLGNEVLDAMPCKLLHWQDGVWQGARRGL